MVNVDYSTMTDQEIFVLLGQKIKEYRLAERKSQQTLAELSGVSVATISHFEQGYSNNLSLKSFMAILRAMGLIDELEKILPELPMNPQVVKKIEKMTPKRIRNKTV